MINRYNRIKRISDEALSDSVSLGLYNHPFWCSRHKTLHTSVAKAAPASSLPAVATRSFEVPAIPEPGPRPLIEGEPVEKRLPEKE